MKIPLLFCLVLITSASLARAADPAPAAPALKTEKLKLGAWEDDIGYRQAVRVGRTLYISGTVGAGAMPAAIRSAYSGLEKTLRHFGLTFAQVVKENIYTTKLDELKANLAIRRAYYGQDFPAATWVQVDRLYEAKDVIEVELIAVFPD